MRINCPCCGERGLEEFTYLGDATKARPTGDAAADVWVEYVYLRENPARRHREFWYHGSGCQSWLVVDRDMSTHAIFSVEFARDVALAVGGQMP